MNCLVRAPEMHLPPAPGHTCWKVPADETPGSSGLCPDSAIGRRIPPGPGDEGRHRAAPRPGPATVNFVPRSVADLVSEQPFSGAFDDGFVDRVHARQACELQNPI